MAKIERRCECCNKTFTAKKADMARGWARFCSKRCKAISQSRSRPFYAGLNDDPQADQGWGEHEVWSQQP